MWLAFVFLFIFLLNSTIREPHSHSFCTNEYRKCWHASRASPLKVKEIDSELKCFEDNLDIVSIS